MTRVRTVLSMLGNIFGKASNAHFFFFVYIKKKTAKGQPGKDLGRISQKQV